MTHGGKRKGAGKKKGSKASHTLKAEKMREFVVNKIAQEVGPILQAQIDAAKGMRVGMLNKQGEIEKVYTKEPDTKAGEYLLNQGIGKAKETNETQVKGVIQILTDATIANKNALTSPQPERSG